MKKYHYLLIPALVMTVVLPTITFAEETSVSIEAEATTELPPKGALPNKSGPAIFSNVRDQIRTKTENVQGDIRENEGLYKKVIKSNIASSSRNEIKVMRADIKDDRRENVQGIRRDGKDEMRNSSSSESRLEIRKEMRKDIFEVRKQSIVKQLNVSLNNLKQIRERISSRIEKAISNGKDMTKATALLVIADAKIATAELAINSIVAFDSSTSLASATDAASSTNTDSVIDLTKPRQVAESAIKALKDAHRALVDVVRAIAHALGNGDNATSTPSVNSTTTTTI